ncbi:TraX family protein [Clostridium estertheticum]|uniref:TraX family protein n=1 Tax=Clostridium estertheticum TaxID=238834 RepID=UPI001CF2AA1E|nr:TraX family protein [Clostridium estertheticum]MCB2354597.1 conjugal transfer protein TraX [Clostridium estertheticum]MCB2358523.1 conjugal transfer protein TraX [Clostridium estertheticum]WAG40845.1 conjugal transfer protein TraX [Clostridium estertheticum]
MKKLNAFQLKNIALIAMIMDHLNTFFPLAFPFWFHPFSRFVAPLFVFLMVEGLFHTRNKLKYNIRLFGWAIFMQAGDFIISKILISKQVAVHNNIFMTLAVGLTVINLFEHSKKSKGFKKLGLIILAILIIPLGVFTEGGIFMIPFTLITYFFREKRNRAIIGYVILCVFFFITSYAPYATVSETIDMLMINSDFLFITVVPFIFLYNGERGLNTKFSKYFFYVFYPLHLWILAIIKFAIK